MSMINSVRETVLSLLNKNNYGYITPNDFNLYAKQAQLDIFEDYFYQYNYQINQENKRQSGTGLADITKGYEEVIDSFSQIKALSHSALNLFNLPSDYCLINKLNYYPNFVTSGTIDQAGPTASNTVLNTTATFISSGVKVGDIISNLTTNEFGYVTQVISETTLLATQLWELGNEYSIVTNKNVREIERVSQQKIFKLTASNLTKPTNLFPAYCLNGNTTTVYPEEITSPGTVIAQYVRYPKAPKWTYFNLVGSEPTFNQTAADYQDFELPQDDEPTLVMKILQFAGMSIREVEAIKFGQSQEMVENQNEQ